MAEQNMASRDYGGYRRLYRRVLLTLLLLAVMPMVGLGWFSLTRINDIYDEKISAGIEALTSSKCRAIDFFMEERIGQIRNLAFTHSYEELSDPTRLSHIFSVLQSHGRSFVDIGAIDLDGRHAAYVGPYDLKNADYHEEPWFAEVLHKGVFVSDVFLGKRHIPHFIIAVLRHEGDRSFILRATIDMDAIKALLQRVYAGHSSDAFLLNESGVLQSDSMLYGKVMQKTDLPVGEVRRGRSIAIHALSDGQSGSENFVGAFLHLESMPWVLVVTDDLRESLVPLQQLKLFILLFVLGGLVIVCTGAIVSTKRLVSFIQQKDRQQANIDARLLQSSKMAALGKMAAGVAHEVNNPLMLIQENAGWIGDLMGDEDPKLVKNYGEIAKSCERIISSVQRARGITQRMLGFGRRMNLGRSEVMLNVVADHVVELLSSEAASRSIVIEKNYGAGVPVVLSDPAQLEQVVLNIVDNAIDAIGKDGVVTITTSAADKDGAKIAIADNGEGLDEETISKIFDPFFTTKKVGEGTGLGLAICFNILDKLGGKIDVSSVKGKGTTFVVTLPAEPPNASGTEYASCPLPKKQK